MKIAIRILPILWCLSSPSYCVNGIFTLFETGHASYDKFPSANEAGAEKMKLPSFPSACLIGIGYNHDLYSKLGVGLEVDYRRAGMVSYSYTNNNKTNIYLRNLSFLASAQWHQRKWDIIGKAGVTRQRIVISGVNIEQENGAKLCPEIGIDLAYNVSANWGIVGSVDHVVGSKVRNIQRLDRQAIGMDMVLVGVRIIF